MRANEFIFEEQNPYDAEYYDSAFKKADWRALQKHGKYYVPLDRKEWAQSQFDKNPELARKRLIAKKSSDEYEGKLEWLAGKINNIGIIGMVIGSMYGYMIYLDNHQPPPPAEIQQLSPAEIRQHNDRVLQQSNINSNLRKKIWNVNNLP